MTTQAYKVELDLSRDDNRQAIQYAAMSLPSFLHFKIKEMGVNSKLQDNIWFKITVLFTKEADAVWFRLKWAE